MSAVLFWFCCTFSHTNATYIFQLFIFNVLILFVDEYTCMLAIFTLDTAPCLLWLMKVILQSTAVFVNPEYLKEINIFWKIIIFVNTFSAVSYTHLRAHET